MHHGTALQFTAQHGRAQHGMSNHLSFRLKHFCRMYYDMLLFLAILLVEGTGFGGADTAEADAQQPGERVPGGISHHAPQPAQHGGGQPPDHSCGPAH